MILDFLQEEDLEKMNYEYEKEREQFSNWIFDKKSYSPAVAIEIVKEVKSGVYKLNNDYQMVESILSSDDLLLLPDSKVNYVLNELNLFLNSKDKFKKANLIHKRGFLLIGPPGTGKTSIITLINKEIIDKYKGVVFLVNSIADFHKLYDFLSGTFRRIEPNRFVVTIIEDIDKIINENTESEILDFFDGKSSINHHLIISTSNDTSDLPDALLRTSRIDKKFIIDYPCDNTRYEYFKSKGISEDKLKQYVEISKDMSLAELKELFIGTEVMEKSIEEVVNNIKEPFEKKEYLNSNDNKSKMKI